MREHGTTEEAQIVRFARDEAHRLKPLRDRPAFGSLRDLVRVVGNDCAIEVDGNSYSVPWRLIGERVAVTVAAGRVRIRQGGRQVAAHEQARGRRQRIVDPAHLDGIAGNGPSRAPSDPPPIIERPPPAPSLLRPLAEYEAAIGEASDAAREREDDSRDAGRSARPYAGAAEALRHSRPARQPLGRGDAKGPSRPAGFGAYWCRLNWLRRGSGRCLERGAL